MMHVNIRVGVFSIKRIEDLSVISVRLSRNHF
jgi:hypothetical protein